MSPMASETTASGDKPPPSTSVLEAAQDSTPQNSPEVESYSTFSDFTRTYLTYLLGVVIVLSTLTATIYFPLIPLLSSDFSVSVQAINLTVTVYAILQGVSPPIIASFSDAYGRRPVLLGLIVIYSAACLGLSLGHRSYTVLLALRALQSIGGSATPALAYGIVADVAVVSERGKMLGPMLSTCNAISALGPIIGGAVAQTTGAYKWVFFALLILSLACFMLVGLTMPETARSVVGNGSMPAPTLFRPWCCCATRLTSDSASGKRQDFNTPRPQWGLMMAFHSLRIILYPDTAAVLWMVATSYSVYYTFQVAIPIIFADIYHYHYFTVGLTFLPGLAGMTIGGIVAGKLVDRNFAAVARKQNIAMDREKFEDLGDFPIESARYRHIFIPVIMEVALVVAYGWVILNKVHPALPLVMQFFICASSTLLSHTASALLVDIFVKNSSASYAAGQLMRCGLAAASAAVLDPLVRAVGQGWYFTIFGCFVGSSALVSVTLSRNVGAKWRERRRTTAK
ncbi:hypothetical protein Daus18300_006664 [Diaporthe australafricana]|uniref:Major facilitator superfamily (MFS) profile domain-containing protein n=1 Tax=Diaporthe australafricana TaxID=127596 RepID=A0ABR3WT00_9PEZI